MDMEILEEMENVNMVLKNLMANSNFVNHGEYNNLTPDYGDGYISKIKYANHVWPILREFTDFTESMERSHSGSMLQSFMVIEPLEPERESTISHDFMTKTLPQNLRTKIASLNNGDEKDLIFFFVEVIGEKQKAQILFMFYSEEEVDFDTTKMASFLKVNVLKNAVENDASDKELDALNIVYDYDYTNRLNFERILFELQKLSENKLSFSCDMLCRYGSTKFDVVPYEDESV